MLKSIAIASSKGGTGKTTIALNLAVALAERGRSTLLVDVDPQGGIGHSLARSDTEWPGLAELVAEQATLEELLVPTKLSGLSMLPRGRLDAVDAFEFEEAVRASGALRQAISALEGRFEYVVVDTPSGFGLATRAALHAVQFALIPIQAEPLALRSLAQALRVIEHVQAEENPSLKLLGLLPTMVELRASASLGVMNEVWTGLAGVMETYVPRTPVFAQASERGLPVLFLAGPVPPEARRFENIASEVEEIVARSTGTTGEAYERAERALI